MLNNDVDWFVCQFCHAEFSRPKGLRGRKPKWCSPACKPKTRQPYKYVSQATQTPLERSEKARKAARARWDASTPQEREDNARRASQARWEGHTAAPKSVRQERECPYCGVVVPMTKTQVSCGALACRHARLVEQFNARSV